MLRSQPDGSAGPPAIPSGTVTFLFTDIEGSTKLLEALRERYAAVLDQQRAILRDCIARRNGIEIDNWGDASFAAFTRAADAVSCAVDAQRTLAQHSWPQDAQVRVRMGLHTGEPVISRGETRGDGDFQGGSDRPHYIGMDVHRTARIASIGYGGQVLLSQTTRDLVYQDLPEGVSLRYLGQHTLKDIRFPQPVYQLEIQGLTAEFPPLNSLPVETDLQPVVDLVPAPGPGGSEAAAYRDLLKRWRAQAGKTLDKARLAMLLGAPADLTVDQEDLILLLRSALAHSLPLEGWLRWSGSPIEAVAALDLLLQEYPPPQARLAIVQALSQIPDPQATQVLLRAAASDDAHAVRSSAALESARRGEHSTVVQELTHQASEQNDPAAIAALVSVIDEFGLPEGAPDIPRFPVAMGLFQRRWQRGREAIRRRAAQAGAGGGLAIGLVGCSLPLLAWLVYPTAFKSNLSFMPVAAWSISGAIGGIVWGGLVGLAVGFATALVDVLRPLRHASAWRFLAASIAGFAHSILMIALSSAGLLEPVAGPTLFTPVYLVYGFLLGGALSWVIPGLGLHISWRNHILRALAASLFIGLVAYPAITLVYQDNSASRLPVDWLYALFMSAGLVLATRKDPRPRTVERSIN